MFLEWNSVIQHTSVHVCYGCYVVLFSCVSPCNGYPGVNGTLILVDNNQLRSLTHHLDTSFSRPQKTSDRSCVMAFVVLFGPLKKKLWGFFCVVIRTIIHQKSNEAKQMSTSWQFIPLYYVPNRSVMWGAATSNVRGPMSLQTGWVSARIAAIRGLIPNTLHAPRPKCFFRLGFYLPVYTTFSAFVWTSSDRSMGNRT